VAVVSGGASRHRSEIVTSREREVLELVCLGRSNEAIAETLNITLETVKSHVKAILGKLGHAGRPELIAWALHTGVVEQRPEEFNKNITRTSDVL